MGDENPIRTLGDYSKPSHECYRNTIELLVGNNIVPLRSDTIRERMRLCLFQFSLRDQASNWLERLPAGSITTWEDLTTRFLAQFFPSRRTAKLCNDILIRTINQSAGGKLRELNAKESWALLEDLALYDNESCNDPRDFAMPAKAIALPQDVPSTSDRHLIELENQVQRLMEAHLALTQPTQVNKVATSCEICSGPHDTQYCMEDPEQAFVEYVSSRTDEAGGTDKLKNHKKTVKNKQARTRERKSEQRPEAKLGKVKSSVYSIQDASLSKFEADFKQQQSEMTNKIDTILKAITDRIAGALPSDTVKNPKLSAFSVLSARSYPNIDPQCLNHDQGSINTIIIYSEKQNDSYDEKTKENEEEENDSLENIHVNPSTPPDPSVAFITEKVLKFNSFFESLRLFPQSSDTEIIRKLDPRENSNRGVSNFTGRIKGMHVFLRNFTYIIEFMIVEDISSIIDPRLSQVVLGKPFVEISNMTHNSLEGVVRFTNGTDKVAYKMPHMIEQYNSLSDLEKEHTKSVYLRNKEDKRIGVEYVMSKILGFYKECLELGPEYVTGMDDEGEVT
ncbi:MAK10-like protein [Tanacetum coccineum]